MEMLIFDALLASFKQPSFQKSFTTQNRQEAAGALQGTQQKHGHRIARWQFNGNTFSSATLYVAGHTSCMLRETEFSQLLQLRGAAAVGAAVLLPCLCSGTDVPGCVVKVGLLLRL